MAANVSMDQVALKVPITQELRVLFYAVTPNESSFANAAQVPDYVNQAFPLFFLFILLETLALWKQGKPILRWNDALSSISAGVASQLPLLVVRSIEVAVYIYIYERYSVVSLPWDSPWTWWLGMLGVDFGYYWVHRFAHEVNFMWAAHQVHHSSEDYNLTTALRQSVLQRYNSWIFYVPMSLFVPPSVFIVHIQFNLLYQFWIHTEVIKTVGPLEYILNTPSHHRVHHGRNRYCIDKNYGGTLIIWDRMFGTFAAESDPVAYGLVHPLSSWDPIYTQLCHWQYILATVWGTPGMLNKVYVLIMGPGWGPGKPRTGLIEDIPDVKAPLPRYNKDVSVWLIVYTWLHFTLVLAGQQVVAAHKAMYSQWVVVLVILYLLWTLTNIGYIYENKWFVPALELLRCITYLVLDWTVCQGGACPTPLLAVRAIFVASTVIWVLTCARSFTLTRKKVD